MTCLGSSFWVLSILSAGYSGRQDAMIILSGMDTFYVK